MTRHAPRTRSTRASALLASLLCALALAPVAAVGSTRAAPLPVLHGYVTGSGQISIRQCASCDPMTEVPAGSYRFVAHDSSTRHNFHLVGSDSGFDRKTTLRGTTSGRALGVVELVAGDDWTFQDDATPKRVRTLQVVAAEDGSSSARLAAVPTPAPVAVAASSDATSSAGA